MKIDLKMKKLDLYVSKNFIKAFFLSLFAFINVFILSQLFKIFRYVADGRMTTSDGFVYVINMLPDILLNVTPLAVLLGSLMMINRMAGNLEIISLKTSGISFRRIILFPVIISVLISFAVYYVNGYIYPNSEKKLRELKGNVVSKVLPKEKRNGFIRDIKTNNVYMIKYINVEKEYAEGLEFIKLNDDFTEIEKVVIAEKGKYNRETKRWELEKAVVNNIKGRTSEKHEKYVSEEYNEPPENFVTLSIDPRLLTTKELKKEIKDLRITGGDIREGMMELGKRYSFPFASFVISFLGLSLGSRYVRGNSAVSIVLCMALGYGYYILQASLESLGKNGLMNPFVSGWLPNIIFLGIGMYFVHKAEY